jgi:hypothetical protein
MHYIMYKIQKYMVLGSCSSDVLYSTMKKNKPVPEFRNLYEHYVCTQVWPKMLLTTVFVTWLAWVFTYFRETVYLYMEMVAPKVCQIPSSHYLFDSVVGFSKCFCFLIQTFLKIFLANAFISPVKATGQMFSSWINSPSQTSKGKNHLEVSTGLSPTYYFFSNTWAEPKPKNDPARKLKIRPNPPLHAFIECFHRSYECFCWCFSSKCHSMAVCHWCDSISAFLQHTKKHTMGTYICLWLKMNCFYTFDSPF